jgi:predicted porin
MRRLTTLGWMAAAIIYGAPAAAEEDDGPTVEFYGTLLPFFENVGTQGATSSIGFQTRTSLLATDRHTGINHERRFRMTSGTSNIGFRGDFPIVGEDFKLIWQVESPAPIDGEGPSNWAARNSHVGFTGGWGTLVYGNWDTPMRWISVTSVNPIRGGYTGDLTAIIGTPGHSVPAWNADQLFRAAYGVNDNPVGFFRHEPNSVQYWSPTLAGFSLRVMYSANEHRIAGIPGNEQPLNPYVVSGSLGFDWEWLRLRYSAELHKDLFGTRVVGGAGPFLDITPGGLVPRSSTDVGHLGLVAVRLNRDTEYETRLVAVGDYLSYHTDVAPPGIINEISRPAFYGLVQQTFGKHNLWAAYGHAFEGSCAYSGGLPCTTGGLAAAYPSGGYMYKFAATTGIYVLGYYLINDVSARYTPFPLLDSSENSVDGQPNLGEISAGADTLGIGIGFVHSFDVTLYGGGKQQPAKALEVKPAPTAKPAVPAPEDEEAPAIEKEAPAAGTEEDPPKVELEEEDEDESAEE